MSTTGNMKKGNVKKRAVGKPGLANSDDYARAIIAEGNATAKTRTKLSTIPSSHLAAS